MVTGPFYCKIEEGNLTARRSADQSAASGLNLCPDQLHVRIYVVFLLLQEKESL